MARTRRNQSERTRRRAQERALAKERSRQQTIRDRIPRPLRSRYLWTPLLAALILGSGVWFWAAGRPVGLPAEPTPAPDDRAGSYRVVYRMTDTAGGEPIISTEILEVRRPYETRIETREGPPPGDGVQSGSVSNREYFWNIVRDGQIQFGVRRQPGTSHRDASYEVFRAAASAGAVDDLGSRDVQGTECRLFAFKEPRPHVLEPPERDNRVESCVTPDGIVMRETWTYNGRTVLVRQAVDVELDPEFTDDRFFGDREPDPDAEESQLIADQQVVTEDEEPDTPPLHPELPDGFELDRRALLFESGGGQAPPRNSYFESFIRNHEIAIVEQGRLMSMSPPWAVDEGAQIDLGELESRLLYFPAHVEVRSWRQIDQDGTEYFRVLAPSRDLALWFMMTLS